MPACLTTVPGDAAPAFDAAFVRRHHSGSYTPPAAATYRIRDYPLAGPDWLRSVRFDIDAKGGQLVAQRTDTPRYPILPLAIQDQRGLRLERRTAPIEVLVVGSRRARACGKLGQNRRR